MRISTERLLLRPHRRDDLDDLFAFHSDPDVARYIPWPVRDRQQTRAALGAKLDACSLQEPGDWLVLAVELVAERRVIGEVLLKWSDAANRQGELGFAFGSKYQGQGYAYEAARAMLGYGFDDFGLHRITALCVAQNLASAALLERLGFSRQGSVDDVVFKGDWVTNLLYALTESEWADGLRPARDQGRKNSAAARSDD